MIKFLDKSWNGKNKHSVYTRCNECKTFGICFPQDDKCGNCGSNDTMQYWDAETISSELEQLQREAFQAGRTGTNDGEGYFDYDYLDEDDYLSSKSREGK